MATQLRLDPLVFLDSLSWERDKYVWQDFRERPWDEILGRIYLLKANDALEEKRYVDALADFEQALVPLSKKGVDKDYYVCALSDKALVQCFYAENRYPSGRRSVLPACSGMATSFRKGGQTWTNVVFSPTCLSLGPYPLLSCHSKNVVNANRFRLVLLTTGRREVYT